MYGPTDRDWFKLFAGLMLLGALLFFVGQQGYEYLARHLVLGWK